MLSDGLESPVDAYEASLKVIREPRVYLVGAQTINQAELNRFLCDAEVTWQTDTEIGAEQLAEIAGRVCYMSYGKGRKTNAEFVGHIIEVGHGSVLEHGVWSFLFTNVSRSFTHELIRHRHFSYSQLSQRYVNESDSGFVVPDVIAEDPALFAIWSEAVNTARRSYDALVNGLQVRFADVTDATLRRKLARQAARSVLPNATETKIFVTANARALRHFIELRGSEHAEVEIRKVAIQVLRIMRAAAPSMFSDYEIRRHSDGSEVTFTEHVKV